MSNNLAQGRQGSQQQIATRTDAQLYPTVSNSGLNLRSKSNTFLARHYNVVEFNSSNGVNNFFILIFFCFNQFNVARTITIICNLST